MTEAPLVVAFVSGKGGVGKTMLAVAFARELSRKAPTLLVDLDFFNRGLTGLMRHGKRHCEATVPDFLGASGVEDQWELTEVAPKLYQLRNPDLTEEQLRHIENYDAATLGQSLRDYMGGLAASCGAVNIVLDCHGGPDKLSFAACLIAKYSLLVSEPDKITFYGTLHFVRQLQSSVGDASMVDLRLIFNKVVPAFSVRYLTNFYNREIRSLFNSHPLLAVFPLEVYLTKEFEKTPFLTDVYPFSLLARKMEVLLLDLLGKTGRDRIPRAVLSLGAITRSHRRRTLGKPVPFLSLNFVTAGITAGFIFYALYSQFFPDTDSNNRTHAFYQETSRIDVLERLERLQKYPETAWGQCKANNLRDRIDCIEQQINSIEELRHRIPDASTNIQDLPSLLAQLRSEEKQRQQWQQAQPALVSDLEMKDGNKSQADVEAYIQTLRRRTDLGQNPDPAIRELYQEIIDYRERSDLVHSQVFPFLAILAVYWFFLAMILTWSQSLDRTFTYLIRVHRYLSSCLPYSAALVIWFLLGLYFAEATNTTLPRIPNTVARSLVLISALPALFVIVDQLLKAWRRMRFGKGWGETAARTAFALLVLVAPMIWHRWLHFPK